MSQLRAKQIKLNAANDLLVGGANGNGGVLSIGGIDQVLKVKADGSLGYEQLKAEVVSTTAIVGVAGTTVQEVLAGLQANIAQEASDRADAVSAEATARGNADTALGGRIDAVNTAAGLVGDAYVAKTGANYIASATSLFDADDKLDVALKALADTVATNATGSTDAINAVAADLATEVSRATAAEEAIASDLADEIARATAAEQTIADNLAAEITRATGAEGTLTTNLATEVSRATAAEEAIASDLADEVTRATGAESALGLRIDNLTASQVAFSNASMAGITSVDAALVDLDSRVDQLVGLNALHFAGTVAGDIDAEGLTALNAVSGNVYRVITAGAANFAGTSLEVNVGDFVAYTGSVWVKFDNTDPAFVLAAGEASLTLTGNAHAGYELGLVKADVTSSNSAIVVTGGTEAALKAVSVEFVPSAVSINDLSGVANVAHGGTGLSSIAQGELIIGNSLGGFSKLAAGTENTVLGISANGDVEYAFVTSIYNAEGTVVASVVSDKLTAAAATVDADAALAFTTKGWVESKFSGAAKTVVQEEFAGAAAVAGKVAYTLAHSALAGSIAVFVNGLKLKAAAFTVTGTALEIDVATVGYDLDASDLVAVEYQYNG